MNNNNISHISNIKNLNKSKDLNLNSNVNKKNNNSLYETCKNFFLTRELIPMFSFQDIVAGSFYTFPVWITLLIIIGIIIII